MRTSIGIVAGALGAVVLGCSTMPEAQAPGTPLEGQALAYEEACNRGGVQACAYLAVMHDAGKGAPLDHLRAVQLYQKACGGGFAPACYVLGGLSEKGVGV